MASDFFRQGSHGTDTVTELITFWAYTASNHVSTIRKAGASSGYQVTAGKTLYITRIMFGNNVNASALSCSVGYGDTDVGFSSASDPTNYVSLIGNNHIGSTSGNQSPFQWADSSALPIPDFNVLIPVLAAKFPAIFLSGDGAVYLEGFEA